MLHSNYQHSGRFGALTIPAALFGAGLLAAVLGVVYSYVIYYVPIVGYVTFILSGGFGLVAGLATGWLVHKTKGRNNGLATLLGLVVGLVGWYVSWAIYVAIVMDNPEVTALGLSLRPDVLFSVIAEINTHGVWSLKGWTPTGAVLWGLWGLELLLIAGVSTYTARGYVADEVFCEAAEDWCEAEDLDGAFDGDDTTIIGWLQNRQWQNLGDLGPADASTGWFQFRAHRSPTPQLPSATFTLSADFVTPKVDKDGDVSFERNTVVDRMLISLADLDVVAQILAEASARNAEPVEEPQLAAG